MAGTDRQHRGRHPRANQAGNEDARAVQGVSAQRRLHDHGVRRRDPRGRVQQAAGRGVPDHDEGAHAGKGTLRRLSARGRRDEGDERRSSAREATDFRCARRWNGNKGPGSMFSQSLEVVLTIAYREATTRRHTHLTLEHLLYALAHDQDGERILSACGADLPKLRRDLDKYLKESVEQFGRGTAQGTRADARLPPRAADRRAARAERRPAGSAVGRRARGDAAAEQVVRGAAARRPGHHAARRPRLHHARRHARCRRPAGRTRRRVRRRRRGLRASAAPARRATRSAPTR